MPYGTLKADTLTYYTATGDVNLAISGIAISGSPLISGVSGVFTTSVSGATVTGNAGQFTTITGGTAQFTNITGVSGTFTSRISGATVTGTSGQFTTITATTGVFTTSVSGATISGDVGLFTTISGSQGVFNSGLSVPSGTAASPSISFNGDPNTGLYSTGADALALSTNGAGRLFVDANGNVCLKKEPANPNFSKSLTVVATDAAIALRANSSGTYTDQGIFFAVDGVNYSQIYNDGIGELIFRTGSGLGERLRITAAGLVGIGTSSPANALNIVGSSATTNTGATVSIDDNAALAAEVGGTIALRGTDGTATRNYALIKGGKVSSVSGVFDGFLAFHTRTNGQANTTERLRINEFGNVGIGTTTPSFPLEVRGSTNGLQLLGSDNANATWRIGTPSSGVVAFGGNLDHNVAFGGFNAASNAFTERCRIDASGRLLVGTSSARTITVVPTFQIEGTGAVAGAFQSLVLNRNTDAAGPRFAFGRTRGTANGQFTAVQSGDSLGDLRWYGADGTTLEPYAAEIRCEVDGIPGTNDMPGRLVFSTTADGASSPTERVRISQNGVVTVKNGAVAEIGTLTDGATVTPDFAANCNFTLTISGNRTLANPTNITAGQTGSIFIIQGTGSNALSWGSYWDFAGGTAPTLSTASGAVDRVDYVVRTSTSIHTVFTANYS